MNKTKYPNDLSKEQILSKILDGYYPKIFKKSKYTLERINELGLQHQGVDLILDNGKNKFYVDEKAQLDYLNSSLPTFAFELSYLKNRKWHKGWFLDSLKITNIYFLITSIYTKEGKKLNHGVIKFKITGVYRKNLISTLSNIGLTEAKLSELEKKIRNSGKHGRFSLSELNRDTEGLIYFSKDNKAEEPINLVLKLDFLIKNKIGKTIFNL